jgi:predicted dehydrogenase
VLKVAIVGSGKIADDHVSQIRRIPGCDIVAVCDREPLMSWQLAERFGIQQHYGSLSELLEGARPDVVHITTPPTSHYEIARTCLERGCHVYVEKPFTLNSRDARELISLANGTGLKLTAGHDDQFTHAARRMRECIRQGYLGGPPVHMESYYCYDLSEPAYARALLGDRRHWVRSLPGGLLQNIISHGIARIAEFLTTENPHVVALGFVSPMLKRMGETEIIDELRVIVCEEERLTSYFTFSSQMRPSLRQFRIYGPRNSLVLDHDQDTLVRLRGAKYKSYLEKFVAPVGFATQYVSNVTTNARTFLANDLHMKSGMKYLIEAFYRSISENAPLPITYREILLTATIMDVIFGQLRAASADETRPGAGGPHDRQA